MSRFDGREWIGLSKAADPGHGKHGCGLRAESGRRKSILSREPDAHEGSATIWRRKDDQKAYFSS
jgi:hypothetical protein